jgi:peptide/nickel transport system permease protein
MTTQQQTSEIEVDTYGERFASFGRELLSNRNAVLGLALLVPIFVVSVFAPVITPHDPTATNASDRFEGPSGEYLLGTDNFGRDLLSRVMLGGRTTLYLGLTAVGLALALGVPVGLAAGYLGGRVDEVLMRAMDILMSIPSLLLALLIVSMLSANVTNAVLAIGIVYAPRIARIVRGSTLSVKNEAFVAAAEARGESDLYIMFGEILPNVVSPIIVEASIRIGFAIIIGTSLSFLGLGTQPPQADWGFMIAQARSYIFNTVWFLLWPSLLLGATVLGFNLLGDGLRDVLDPRVTGEDL